MALSGRVDGWLGDSVVRWVVWVPGQVGGGSENGELNLKLRSVVRGENVTAS